MAAIIWLRNPVCQTLELRPVCRFGLDRYLLCGALRHSHQHGLLSCELACETSLLPADRQLNCTESSFASHTVSSMQQPIFQELLADDIPLVWVQACFKQPRLEQPSVVVQEGTAVTVRKGTMTTMTPAWP